MSNATTPPLHPFYRVIIAWLLIILILWGVSKTRIGYTVLFYLVLLTIVLLAVIHYKDFYNMLKPALTGRGL